MSMSHARCTTSAFTCCLARWSQPGVGVNINSARQRHNKILDLGRHCIQFRSAFRSTHRKTLGTELDVGQAARRYWRSSMGHDAGPDGHHPRSYMDDWRLLHAWPVHFAYTQRAARGARAGPLERWRSLVELPSRRHSSDLRKQALRPRSSRSFFSSYPASCGYRPAAQAR